MIWHQRLVARKWDYASLRCPGRLSTAAAIRKLVIRMAIDDLAWGHRRVQGELVKLGHPIAASTVWQILHDAGINPAPRRAGPTWKQFLTAQARGILAADFVHADTVLLRRLYALVVIDHGTRRVHLAGITANPDGGWTTQAARNFLMDLGQRAASVKFLIRDREAVHRLLRRRIPGGRHQDSRQPSAGAQTNAIRERMIGTLRRGAVYRPPIVDEHHLRRVLTEYLRIPPPLQRRQAAPFSRPARPGPSMHPAARAVAAAKPSPPCQPSPAAYGLADTRSCQSAPANAARARSGASLR